RRPRLLDGENPINPYPERTLAFCGVLALQAFLAGRKARDAADNRTNFDLLALKTRPHNPTAAKTRNPQKSTPGGKILCGPRGIAAYPLASSFPTIVACNELRNTRGRTEPARSHFSRKGGQPCSEWRPSSCPWPSFSPPAFRQRPCRRVRLRWPASATR